LAVNQVSVDITCMHSVVVVLFTVYILLPISLCVFIAIKFIDEAECEEVTRLRIDVLRKKEEHEKLCNLIGWCLRSERYHDDDELIAQHFTLLDRLHRDDEFIARVILSSLSMQSFALEMEINYHFQFLFQRSFLELPC